MKVYRYEQIDGGGPFFTRDGKSRFPKLYPDMEWEGPLQLSGCLELTELQQMFKEWKIDLSLYTLKIYETNIITHRCCKGSEVLFVP